MENKEHHQFKWFFTSSGKLVIGGKSAEQNEIIVKSHIEKEDVVLHTALPGSPFAVIKAQHEKISKQDIKEAAIFCASFSQQWKKMKKKAEVHVFLPSQIAKEKSDKVGTFSVKGKIEKINAELRLFITTQNGKIRAVPEDSAEEKMLEITPGKNNKEDSAKMIKKKLKENGIEATEQDIMQALPAGSFEIR